MSPKRLYRWQTSVLKDTLQLMCSGKCKLKTMRYPNKPTRMTKSETLPPLNTGEDVEQHELSFTAGENINTLEDSLTAPYKTRIKQILTI